MNNSQTSKDDLLREIVQLHLITREARANGIAAAKARDLALQNATSHGISVGRIAATLGIGKRRVYKMIERGRQSSC